MSAARFSFDGTAAFDTYRIGTLRVDAAKLNAASYTAADVLAKLLTVDGTGTGLDADLLDGLHAAAFVQHGAIVDADIAASMSELVRTQILQQAGISVLAQANQAPSQILSLLK